MRLAWMDLQASRSRHAGFEANVDSYIDMKSRILVAMTSDLGFYRGSMEQ